MIYWGFRILGGFWIFILVFNFGCIPTKTTQANKFVLTGIVGFKSQVVEGAKVTVNVRKGVQWISEWATTTDSSGRYRVEIGSGWFTLDYRIRVLYRDNLGKLWLSPWEYGIVKLGAERKDFNL